VVRNLIQHKNIGGIVYSARDITERKHAQEQLLFSATHDALTGLPDRVLFLGRLQTVVDRMKRHPHESAAVLFIDIDDFKVVNDCYGHAIGDALIKKVSNRLRACMRTLDGTRKEHMEFLVTVPLLILDDLGMRKLPLTAAEELLEIIMRRYERASTMLTSNRPVEDWGKLLGDAAAVSAMLDRLLHHGHVLKCGPRSWRTKLDAPEH